MPELAPLRLLVAVALGCVFEIGPAFAQTRLAPQESVLAYIPDYGFVRDTPAALASLMHPLAPALGRNDLVEACRAIDGGEVSH